MQHGANKWVIAVALLAGAACKGGKGNDGASSGAAKAGPITVTATATAKVDQDDERVDIAVTTEPGAFVGVTRIDHYTTGAVVESKPGDGFIKDDKADAAGKLVVTDERPFRDGATPKYRVRAWVSRTQGGPTEQATVEAEVKRVPHLSGWYCVAAPCKFALDLRGVMIELPAGATATVDGKPAVADGAKARVDIDLYPLFKQIEIVNLAGRIDAMTGGAPVTLATWPITVTLPDGVKLEGKMRITDSDLARQLRTTVLAPTKGPMSFGASEPKSAASKRAVIAYDHKLERAYAYGKGKNADELDLVAVINGDINPREIGCGTYRSAGGATASGSVQVADTEVTVYDRRTGKKVASKLFPASASCASSITGPASGGTLSAGGGGAGQGPYKWIESLVKS